MSLPINVYWSVFCDQELLSRQSLLYGDLEKLIPSMVAESKKSDTYHKCFALGALHKNTYFLRHPFDISIDFEGKDIQEEFQKSHRDTTILKIRDPLLHDKITFDLDFQIICFADAPLMMHNTPPYMHKTLFSPTAYQSSGAFDVGKWFRPVSLTYQMFPNEYKVSFKEGEPMCYISFISDKKVNLQRFEMTDKLREVVKGTTGIKYVKPNISLNVLYNKFAQAKRKEIVLREIRNNLV